ncbi:MAG TPA: glycoside hydrolase family 65 [Verrucomicrobiae bacterium]|nr:glycoside hydrolase family 65 [Verrucomicrobiae bacterium]
MLRIFLSALLVATAPVILFAAEQPIDRQALVTRHNVTLRDFDVNNPLSVGNGEFAFTVDATGLQTFPEAFTQTIPLGTLSDWGWHTIPTTNNWSIENFHFKEFTDLNGRSVPYCDVPGNNQTPEIKWLRANPHRLHLGQIGFRLTHADGSPAQTNDLTNIEQTLDLWNGIITSHFQFDGEPVVVETICGPALDEIAVRVQSPLLKQQRLAIQIHFPYGTGDVITADWSKPDAHETILTQPKANQAVFQRKLDNDQYSVAASWSVGATITNVAKHQYVIIPNKGMKELEFVCAFTPAKLSPKELGTFAQAKRAVQGHWNKFWSTGGAIDLSGSIDPRWFELERRIVLSQYLTAIQSAGKNPPQETGLTYNTWMGKFHLEMHWWHEAHFALWNRLPLLERSLDYYKKILPRAEGTAGKQGYAGARWPKMTSPSGVESPSPVGPFLVWQEPHPIFYAELCWRQHQDHATLEKFRDIVFQTANFMSTYATWDATTKRYVLGPVLQCSQEIFPKDKTLNPTFELTYWRWALETAQQWRIRLGLARDEKWDAVLHDLAKPLVVDGKYAFTETTPDSYTNPKWNADHPSVTAALGILPGPGVDPETMRHTLDWVMKNWNWPDTWGWDYPMLAMCAARLGEPERAIDALFLDTPKNHYALNGHVYQRPGLTLYLPANGGLLYAVALMAAGWDGAPKVNAPGFPQNGQWHVRYENLRVAP